MKTSASGIHLGILIMFLLLFGSCGNSERNKTSAPVLSELKVDAKIVKPRIFETELKTTANILPFEQVELKAPVSGTVLSINFDEGQVALKGQLIIRLDDRAWIAQEKGLKAQLLSAKADLKRKQELLSMEGASQQDVDQAMANVDALDAQIEELEVKINLANVTAPFDGRLGMRDFSLGSYLNQGQSITTLSQVWKLKVDFNIPGQYQNEVFIDKQIKVISGNDTINAAIYAINPIASSSSRTIQVRALIDNNNKKIAPGNYAEVMLPLVIEENALIVPSDCIVPELNKQTVFVYRNGKAFRKEVELGDRTSSEVLIVSGIAAGDTVITSGLMQIRDNLSVKIANLN